MTQKAMTRKKLETLVWRTKHRDFKGENEAGEREIIRYFPAHGTCIVRLRDLTLAELLDELTGSEREALGYQLWRVVLVGIDNQAIGVFSYDEALLQRTCETRYNSRRDVTDRARSLLWAGPRPEPWQPLDFHAQSLVKVEAKAASD